MDYLSFLVPILAWILGFLLLFQLWRLKIFGPKIQGMLAPEPSGALPFIGHLHQLGGQDPLHRTFAAIADKYGSIFMIRLGMFPTIVVSNNEIAKECFTINDKIFASRPRSTHGVYLGYNFAGFGFAPYGTHWRNMRKLTMLELLSTRRLDTLKHLYVSEINTFVKDLYMLSKNKNGKGTIQVVISEWFQRLSFNMITKIIAGKRYFVNFHDEINDGEAERVGKLIREFMHISGVFFVSDLIPFLGWFNLQPKVLNSMKRISRDLDSLVGSWVEEHKVKQRNKSEYSSDHHHEQQDFIDVLLSVVEDDSRFVHDRDTIIKSTIMGLILAGADTTSINLTWLLSLLLNNREALKRAQQELDLHVGRNRWVESSDINNLVYLQAIAKETLRLYPPGPVLAPHEAREDCQVAGYQVPKGTRLFVNAWKLHRDPTVWTEPEKFLPERFLTSHASMDAYGQHFQFIPFGSGRRACPGINFATQVTQLTLARLLQGFEFETPMNEAVDMIEGLGITLPKATPLEVILTQRLSSQLYN
ncbi:Cytochrome P450 family protein [Quillaja saponaria]|uniref:Cytochrome P450 family protein n=1 Tax=Quillaja saponaria TaxID=32244 RepID=A0AAD7L405_QUISA|nr:Cytochrome P450 family protein [Quillaja saponaria]